MITPGSNLANGGCRDRALPFTLARCPVRVDSPFGVFPFGSPGDSLGATEGDAAVAAPKRQRGFDLRALTTLIADANEDQPGPMLPWSLLDGLAELIPAEEVSICELDLVNQERELQQGVLEDEPRCLERGESTPGEYKPLLALLRLVLAGSPTLTGRAGSQLDGPVPRPAARPAAAVSGSLPTVRRQVPVVGRAAGAHRTRTESAVLEARRPRLLRPGEGSVDTASPACGGDIRRRGPAATRGPDCARMGGARTGGGGGLGNAEIAARMFTSVSTVRKHLEHVFDRTGVRTRGAAVARMLPELRDIHRVDIAT